MKKTAITILILSGLIGGGVLANSANDAAIEARVSQVKSEFNLNDQQAKRISGILTSAGMSKEEKRAARMDKHIQRRVDKMTKKLGLNETQANQIKDIMVQQREQMRALHEQGKASITALLTAEQANKFSEMRSHRKGKGWGGKHKKRGGHGRKHNHE